MMKENEGKKTDNRRRRKSKGGKNDMPKPANADIPLTPVNSKIRNEQIYQTNSAKAMQGNRDNYDGQMARQAQQYFNNRPQMPNVLPNAVYSQGGNMYGTIFEAGLSTQPLATGNNMFVVPDKDYSGQNKGRIPRESLSPNERPIMPPPPLPLLQSPKYKISEIPSGSNHGTFDFKDLPPPPSPPHDNTVINHRFQHIASSVSPSPSPLSSTYNNSQVENSELPLPPPPVEFTLQDPITNDTQEPSSLEHNQNSKSHMAAPPPPPPPLTLNFSNTLPSSPKPLNDIHQARNSVLDDIRRGMTNIIFKDFLFTKKALFLVGGPITNLLTNFELFLHIRSFFVWIEIFSNLPKLAIFLGQYYTKDNKIQSISLKKKRTTQVEKT